MRRTFARALVPCLLAACGLPPLAGCVLPVPYAYPTVAHIPPAGVGRSDKIRVYRVDIDDVHAGSDADKGGTVSLGEATVGHTGWTLPQTRMCWDYGWFGFGLTPDSDQHVCHTARLRCYRSGYQTVEVYPWETPAKVSWKKVEDLEAQEQAVDDLVCTYREGKDRSKQAWLAGWKVGNLASGITSEEHKEALLFAAGEYETLALMRRAANPQDEENIARLEFKVQHLRDLAER